MDELTRLLLAAADGDRDALTGFVRQTQAEVWRFTAHLVDPAAADDLTQEVYVRALGSIPRFRGDASARTWLLAVARRVAADEIRRRQRRRRLPDPVVEPVPDAAGDIDSHALLAELDPDRRAAFVLTQLLGWSYAEAAAVCDVPIGTIRSRVARAREQLWRALHGTAAAHDADADAANVGPATPAGPTGQHRGQTRDTAT
jgi:RNA polymerase sigma-70 factor, ECF subfamily